MKSHHNNTIIQNTKNDGTRNYTVSTYRVVRLFRAPILGVKDPASPINASELQ